MVPGMATLPAASLLTAVTGLRSPRPKGDWFWAKCSCRARTAAPPRTCGAGIRRWSGRKWAWSSRPEMAYYPDLTRYGYGMSYWPDEGEAWNVGWLEGGHPF